MTDLLIAGGGVMGLWAALIAGRAGLDVTLAERATIGAGASGGLLGALMPHMPDRWNAKKQFQFEALVSLESRIGALEAETGLSAGYRRTGRLVPFAKEHLRDIAVRQEADAAEHWRSGSNVFAWTVGGHPAAETLLTPQAVAHGAVFDALSARVSPRGLLRLLTGALRRMPNVTVREGCGLVALDPAGHRASLSDGRDVTFSDAILAAGVDTFPLLDSVSPGSDASGVAVKGQAALLAADIDPMLPIIFSDGVYIVAHDDGKVAVGSTSETVFASPFSTDEQLDDCVARAVALMPALSTARIVERWAGLRPKAIGRDPMAGPHPDHPHLHVMTGGFKISFGIAHRLADAVIGGIVGTPGIDMPSSFDCASHLALRSV